jgi:hypothetical protein
MNVCIKILPGFYKLTDHDNINSVRNALPAPRATNNERRTIVRSAHNLKYNITPIAADSSFSGQLPEYVLNFGPALVRSTGQGANNHKLSKEVDHMTLLKTVAPEDAQGEVENAYAFFVKSGMPVPKPLEMVSVSPELIRLQSEMLDYYMKHPSLGFALLTSIRFMVARRYNFKFCTNFNMNFLKMQGMQDTQLEQMVADPQTAPLEERERAMLLFVLKALDTPDDITGEEMDALRELGWTDRDIFDAVFHGANMIGSSFMMKAFKMDT